MLVNEDASRRDCIILRPLPKSGPPAQPGAADDAELQAALSARGWFGRSLTDPHLAFAELCLAERAHRLRQRHEQPTVSPVLVVVEPERWEKISDLLAARARYLPGAAVWSWCAQKLTMMAEGEPEKNTEVAATDAHDHIESNGAAAFRDDVDVEADGDPWARLSAAWSAPPALRLTEPQAGQAAPSEAEAPDSAEPGSDDEPASTHDRLAQENDRLSREEVSMLLERSEAAGEERAR